MGRRVQQDEYGSVGGGWGVIGRTRYYYDGWRVLTETTLVSDGQGGYTESRVRDLIYGNELDEVLMVVEAEDVRKRYFQLLKDPFIVCLCSTYII